MANGAIGQGGIASVRLDQLVPAIQQSRIQELAIGEQQQAQQQQAAINQALQGADLTSRQDVTSRLQGVAPQQALAFSQQTRGQPQQDIEFGLFMAKRLANAARQVTDQAGFDAVKKQALDLGFRQEDVDKLGDTFDRAKLNEAADALDALNPAALTGTLQELGEPGTPGAGFVGQVGPGGKITPGTIKSKATAQRKEGEVRKFKDKNATTGITEEIAQEFKGGKWVEIGRAPETSSGDSKTARIKNRDALIASGASPTIANAAAFGTLKQVKSQFGLESVFVDLNSNQVVGRINAKGEWVPNEAAFQQPAAAPTEPTAPQAGAGQGSFAGRKRQKLQNGQLVDIEG